VTQDYTKARELYEKAVAPGVRATPSMHLYAEMRLEELSAGELFLTGRYAEALQYEEASAAKREVIETKLHGKPGEQTAGELQQVTWYALFAKDYMKVLVVADRAHTLSPNNLWIETNRAHALMFMGRGDEAKVLYLAHKGQRMSDKDDRSWESVIGQDFADFRKAGLTHPMMADIEKELGISR
jgi:hypothetical protein